MIQHRAGIAVPKLSVQVCCSALGIVTQARPGMCKRIANIKLADCSSEDHCTQWNGVLNKTLRYWLVMHAKHVATETKSQSGVPKSQDSAQKSWMLF